MEIARRALLKGSALVGGSALASRFLCGGLETLAASPPGAPAAQAEEWVPTTCWIGKQDCGVLARKVNGRVVKLEGNPAHPRNVGTLCPQGVAQIMALYDPNRVKTPLVRTNEKGVPGTWRQASWDEALALVAEKVKDAWDRTSGDRRLILWQKGRSHSSALYDTAFVATLKAEMLTHSAQCGDAAVRAAEYTTGAAAGLHADFRHTR